MVFQNPLLANKDIAFGSRHQNMQAEADEHYRILVHLQDTSPEFRSQLKIFFDRKKDVESSLNMSENWQRFIRVIQVTK